jgi:Domain of unknown function (DUF6438)
MKNCILLLCFILCLSSCDFGKKQNIKPQQLLGEWFSVESREGLPFATQYGCTFLSDSTVDFELGFYKSIFSENSTRRVSHFLGNKTRYKIVGDTLKVFSLRDSSWYNIRIARILNDTLELSEGCFQLRNEDEPICETIKYVRHNQKLDTTFKFDAISLTSSGCYGSCPQMHINIHGNGEVEFYGKRYTLKEGYYTSKIPIEKYTELSNNFRKVNISNLKDRYAADHTDDNMITIYFLKEGKIVKKVDDYACYSPSAFICAYSKLEPLYQQLELTQIEERVGKKYFSFE